jgi:hypothetical protein
MNKSKIVPIVVLLLIAGGISWKVYFSKTPAVQKEIQQAKQEQKAEESNTASVPEKTTASYHPGSADVQAPERPVNGTYKGVVEVGASGFNSFVINVDAQKRWEIVTKDFGESLAYEGFATTNDIVVGLKKYLSAMFNKGVNGRNVHFVMSSGALKNPKTKDIAAAIKSMGYVVNEVTADQEGKFALKAALPPAYRADSYVVDMGSGNTKISWYEGSALKTVEAYGAKYYQNQISDDQAYNDLKTKSAMVPKDKTTRCFIIGGVPFTMAKETRQNENDRYTILGTPDDYSAGDDVKKKSGINLYRAIVDGSGTTTYIFDWDANFTIGFLLSMN